MSDSDLLERYQRTGRLEYFGRLYDRYMPLVYGVCLKYLKSVEEAEDAVMQIFEELIPKMERAHVREFRTWLYSVARNHCLQQLRRAGREVPLEHDPGIMESSEIVHLLSEGGTEERLTALERCMERLPEPQRQSISLFFMSEKSYADIADITGWALKSVKSYIQNGKRNLKICIEKTEGQ